MFCSAAFVAFVVGAGAADIVLSAGAAASPDKAGDVVAIGGAQAEDGQAGGVSLQGGSAPAGTGGDVSLQAGAGSEAVSDGGSVLSGPLQVGSLIVYLQTSQQGGEIVLKDAAGASRIVVNDQEALISHDRVEIEALTGDVAISAQVREVPPLCKCSAPTIICAQRPHAQRCARHSTRTRIHLHDDHTPQGIVDVEADVFVLDTLGGISLQGSTILMRTLGDFNIQRVNTYNVEADNVLVCLFRFSSSIGKIMKAGDHTNSFPLATAYCRGGHAAVRCNW